jgi:hypothetical protein
MGIPNRRSRLDRLLRPIRKICCALDEHKFDRVRGVGTLYRCRRCKDVFVSRDGIDFKPIRKITK